MVSATTEPASSRTARVASAEIADSPCTLMSTVRPSTRIRLSVCASQVMPCGSSPVAGSSSSNTRSEEHTSELQSLRHLVCRLLLEKKKNTSSILTDYATPRM